VPGSYSSTYFFGCAPRVIDSASSHGVHPRSVQMVALDEGDRLLELGFVKQVDSILATFLTDSVQRCLFSATMPQGIGELASSVLRDPVNVTVGTKGAGASTVKQRLVFVGREDGKVLALRQLIAEGINPPVLVFVQSKDRAKELYSELAYDGVNIDVIHADRTKSQR
jgi:ATP-dependent RNA helicase DDX52/ROK1